MDGIAGTIVVGGVGRERNLVIDERPHSMIPTTHIKGEINKQGIRQTTHRKLARLQGFPEDFKFVVGDAPLYKQFGNSVSVPVIKAIALEIKKELEPHEQA